MIKVPRSVFILELKEEAVKMVIEGGPGRPGRENAGLKMEREILKNATAYFAGESLEGAR